MPIRRKFVAFSDELAEYVGALGKHWRPIVSGAVLSLASWGYGVANNKAVPTNLYLWLLVGAAIVAGFLAWRDEYRKHPTEGPDVEIAPNGFYEDTRTFFKVHRENNRVPELGVEVPMVPYPIQTATSFLHLRLINRPRSVPSERDIARDVIARIHFLDKNDRELFFIDGRWSDTTQPPHLPPSTPGIELLTVTIGIGQIRELDIAFKFRDESQAYAFNNDSYQFQFMQNPAWRILQGTYKVRVNVVGPLVNREWILPFRVGAKGERMQVLT